MEAQPEPAPRTIRWFAMTVLGGLCLLAVVPALMDTTRNSVRKASRTLQSINNLKNMASAVHIFAGQNDGKLPRTLKEPAPLSWRTQILDFVDRGDLRQQYQTDVPWNANRNADLARRDVKVFDAAEGGQGKLRGQDWSPSDYGMISGPGTVQPGDRAVTLDEISAGDGLGTTLVVVECVGLRLGWAEPRDPHIEREQIGVEVLSRPGQKSTFLLSTYSQFVPVAFADGAARGLNPKIDLKVLRALCTIDGGEPVTIDDILQ